MKNLSKCPVCNHSLDDAICVCPQCGNSEIEDVDIIGASEVKEYGRRLEAKQAAWAGMTRERQRLSDAIEREKNECKGWQDRLKGVKKEAADLDSRVSQEKDKQRDIERQIENLAKELL